MLTSVAAVMRYCRNYFETGYIDGTFRITGNALHGADGARWVYISGSQMHNGVWELSGGYLTGRSVEGLEDEEFDGRVWFLDPPEDFLDLCKAIREYEDKNPVSALASESFGGYSRQWASGLVGKTGLDVFADRLKVYRTKMYTEVK